MRSLYARLFVAFLVVVSLSLWGLWLSYQEVSGPNVTRMIMVAQEAQAAEAAAALRRGGRAELETYIQRLRSITQMPHYVIDESGRDVLSSTDRSEFLGRGPRPTDYGDTLAFVTPTGDGVHRFVTLAPPPYALENLIPYLAVILAGVTILFWLIVADLVRPLRRVANAVRQFGHGNFAVRAPVQRKDEIGHLAAAFNDMAARIETLVTAERRLLQDVSHELRSPLTRLNVGIELSRTAVDRQQAADRLQREASRLSTLVETLLEVVRLEGDPASTPMSSILLNDLLRDCVESASFEAAQHDVCVGIEGQLSGTIEGNAELLRRAFDNVIGNATRYAPPDSVVRVECHETDAEYVVTVRDSGPGVDESQLAKLGSPFYRTDASRSSDTGGVGLGLAIARRAIHLHRGTIEFSNGNPGLVVVLRLPAGERRSTPLRENRTTQASPAA